MPQKRRPTKKYNGYTTTEAELLEYAQWILVFGFVCLTIAVIITASQKLFYMDMFVGLVIGYAVKKKWFKMKASPGEE